MPAALVQYPPIRRLRPADLAACVALAVGRGWAPERSKWALLLAASEAFGVDAPDAPDGGLAGGVVLTRWAPDFASVGMMLVAARHARRGLGQALMEHVLAEAGDATVTLFATDMGRPLYEKLGFRQVRRNIAVVGWFRPPRPPRPPRSPRDVSAETRVRVAAEADMAAILAVDQAAFGADRGAILTRLPGFAERVSVLEADAAGRPGVIGYAAAWRNGPTTVIGPVVAPDADRAGLLIAELASRARGPVRLDLDPDRPELPAWARARGLRPISGNAVMARGEDRGRGRPSTLHTPISIALA